MKGDLTMKKIVCLVFALLLCLSVAMAEAPLSPTSRRTLLPAR